MTITTNTPTQTLENSSTTKCILCGNSERTRVLFELYSPILKCMVCSLVFAKPIATVPGDPSYTESYYKSGAYADYLGDRNAIHKNASRTLAQLERLVQGRTLLDVGCAAGFFLEAARARGWNVRGLEISEYASDYARHQLHLPIDTGSIESPPAGLPKFDVITLWDTIEHLGRPDRALSNIYDLLSPQGVLVLSTGDYGSLLRRITGKKWRLFSDSTHKFFFDKDTLKKLMSQKGFRFLQVTRKGKWVSLPMILHQSGLPLACNVRDLLITRGWNPSLYVNLWDVITVFAKPIT
jgi:2-polyprenyl-3-methyl-5-hydroxy-6-metoxy-1,4-benzoquinol methylase